MYDARNPKPVICDHPGRWDKEGGGGGGSRRRGQIFI